ncbi:MAG: phosphate ABC transporter substrate-binding protein [Eubacteriaceae bacterium]|nr:phosphate ABC transporter substrate-binding protein [Eubacteriaceae bacterium]
MGLGINTRKRAAIAFYIALLSIGSLLAGCQGRERNGIVVAGSTSVQPYAEVLAEEFAVMYPESSIDVQGGGSSAGITAATSGTADIGMSSRELSEKEQHLWSKEIAKDGLAIIVHPDNPLRSLSLEQISLIYSGQATKWSDVGGSSESKIHIVTREEGSGTRSAFSDLVMGDVEISPRAIVQDSNGAVKQLISDDLNSIGFLSLGLVDDSVKALMLNGVKATKENIINGSYGLFRPFLFVVNGEPTDLALEFIDFAVSEQGREILSTEGLIAEE